MMCVFRFFPEAGVRARGLGPLSLPQLIIDSLFVIRSMMPWHRQIPAWGSLDARVDFTVPVEAKLHKDGLGIRSRWFTGGLGSSRKSPVEHVFSGFPTEFCDSITCWVRSGIGSKSLTPKSAWFPFSIQNFWLWIRDKSTISGQTCYWFSISPSTHMYPPLQVRQYCPWLIN